MENIVEMMIRKPPYLYQRYPNIRHFNSLVAQNPCWILFGKPARFISLSDKIAKEFGIELTVVCAWHVFDYEVLLISGDLSLELKQRCRQMGLDCAPYAAIPRLQQAGLAIFDMDSTAIQIECIDEIAKLAGVGGKVAQITERAMQGELDFAQSLRERVATLKGADASILAQVRDNLPYTRGFKPLVSALQQRGWKVAIASGGFDFFADKIKQELTLDHTCANQLEIKNNKLTGEVLGEIVDAKAKARVLQQLTERYALPVANTIAVGDGANDLPMLATAGLGIAYHAKPKVQQAAQVALCHSDLRGVLCVLSASLFVPEKK